VVTRQQIVNVVKELPPVVALRRLRYERRFSSPAAHGMFWGVYRTFEEARAAAPQGRNVGFDHDAVSEIYPDRVHRIFAYDYPVLFWLRPLLADGLKVFDIGGHVGVHYISYRRYLPELARVFWTTCDVPAVAEAGRRMAAARGDVPKLSFTSDLRQIAGHDIVFASGSLQYIDSPSLAELLQALPALPRHLILNKVPLQDGPTFVTLQNAKVTFTPTCMRNRDEFVGSLTALGYEVVDSWDVPEREHYIPMQPEHSFGASAGLYMTLRPKTAA
jgi:putative methyltransferase (TIGR04325 family)